MKKIRNFSVNKYKGIVKNMLVCTMILCLITSLFTEVQAVPNYDNFDGGSGHTSDTAYEINTVTQFLKFAEEINNGKTYEGYYFKLGNDIDLKDVVDFKSIGSGGLDESKYDSDSPKVEFQGFFDGCGHSIINVKIGETNFNHQGLFACIGTNGVITRLIVDADIKGHQYAGIIAAKNKGIIKNCATTETSSIFANGSMGGIVSYNQGEVINCYNLASITSYNTWDGLLAHTGGIVGSEIAGSGIVKNCYNTGIITFSAGNRNSWGQISSSNYGVTNCYYDEAFIGNNGSGVGTLLSENFMKNELANTLNSNLNDMKDETLCMWTQIPGEYPVLTNIYWQQKPTIIEIASTSDNVWLDETAKYTAVVGPENASNKSVLWSVENLTGAASINSAGVLTPSKEGTIKIKARSAEDESIEDEVSITIVKKAILVKINEFEDINDIENGTSLENIILPNFATIVKEGEIEDPYVRVSWNRNSLSYNRDSESAQKVTIYGNIELPGGVYNEYNVDTSVKIDINILAKNKEASDNKGGVRGYVLDENSIPLSNIVLKLTKGGSNKTSLFESRTNEIGEYTFVNVPNGMYSIVAIKNGQVVTKTISINEKQITQNINMPASNLDTKLETSNDTPDIAADNLENVVNITADNIEVRLVVDKKDEKIAEGASQIKAVLTADEHVDMFLDATLWSTINDGVSQTIQPKAGSKIKITIDLPESIRGKKSYSIIRYHEGVAERLLCDYDADLNVISFETDKFSTYALTYEEKAEVIHRESVTVEEEVMLPFTDVVKKDSYYSALKYMYENEYISGTSDTEFEPDISTSRAMIVTILWRMNGKPESELNLKSYEDIDSDAYYLDAINWAINNDIINGYNDTVLAPDDEITREQFATILERYADYASKSTYAKIDISIFEDDEIISDYAINSVNWLLAEKILECDDYKINPKAEAKRHEIVQMLYNFVK